MTDHTFVDTSTLSTMAEAFAITSSRHPDKDCICIPARAGRDYAEDGLTWSYGEVAEKVLALRRSYEQAGYGRGQRIAILLENRPSFVLHFLALNGIGVSVVPINTDSTAAEIASLLVRSHAILMVALPKKLKLAEDAIARLERAIPLSREEVPLSFPAAVEACLPGKPDRTDEAGLLFTSGTTDLPKGAKISNGALIYNGERYLMAGGAMQINYGSERLYNPLPLTYANSFAHTNIVMILSAGCMIFPDRFHPSSWWQEIIATRATIVHHMGMIVPMLLKLESVPEERMHTVRYSMGVGADSKQYIDFERRFGFPLIEVYAMTEIGICSFASREPRLPGEHFVGQPLPTIEYRIVDEHDNDVEQGQPGQVLVRRTGSDPRAGFFSGYLDNDELTEHLWRGGWFHTGDSLRQDGEGRYFWVDRLKDMVRRSGQNISTAEVELCLRGHPAVSEVACVPGPDSIRQEEVVACVVLAQGHRPTRETGESIVKWALANISYFKAPGGIVFLSQIPLTKTNKIQKQQIFMKNEDIFAREDCFDFRSLKKRQELA